VGLANGVSLPEAAADVTSGKRALDTRVTDATALERSNE
jgi:hypothetical protein